MAFLWSLVVIDPLIILSTILCGCVSIVCTLFDKSGNTAIRVGRVWARSLLKFAGVRVRVEGLDKIHADGFRSWSDRKGGRSQRGGPPQVRCRDRPLVRPVQPAESRAVSRAHPPRDRNGS